MFLTKLKTKFLKPYYAEMSECERKTAFGGLFPNRFENFAL